MIIHACPLSVDRFIPYRQQLPGGPFYALYSPKNSENIAKKTSVEDWMDKEIFGLLLALTRREFLYYVQVHFEYFLHTGLIFPYYVYHRKKYLLWSQPFCVIVYR